MRWLLETRRSVDAGHRRPGSNLEWLTAAHMADRMLAVYDVARERASERAGRHARRARPALRPHPLQSAIRLGTHALVRRQTDRRVAEGPFAGIGSACPFRTCRLPGHLRTGAAAAGSPNWRARRSRRAQRRRRGRLLRGRLARLWPAASVVASRCSRRSGKTCDGLRQRTVCSSAFGSRRVHPARLDELSRAPSAPSYGWTSKVRAGVARSRGLMPGLRRAESWWSCHDFLVPRARETLEERSRPPRESARPRRGEARRAVPVGRPALADAAGPRARPRGHARSAGRSGRTGCAAGRGTSLPDDVRVYGLQAVDRPPSTCRVSASARLRRAEGRSLLGPEGQAALQSPSERRGVAGRHFRFPSFGTSSATPRRPSHDRQPEASASRALIPNGSPAMAARATCWKRSSAGTSSRPTHPAARRAPPAARGRLSLSARGSSEPEPASTSWSLDVARATAVNASSSVVDALPALQAAEEQNAGRSGCSPGPGGRNTFQVDAGELPRSGPGHDVAGR